MASLEGWWKDIPEDKLNRTITKCPHPRCRKDFDERRLILGAMIHCEYCSQAITIEHINEWYLEEDDPCTV